jgi:hypothetical protein
MILYVNGDSHAAAAECVNSHAWALDDEVFWGLGQQPHPDNERASFGCELANWLYAVLYLDAQAGCSNARIMRTTREWIAANPDAVQDCFMVIQWTTWERQEWWHNGKDYQVNASGIDHVPPELQDRYRQFVLDIDWHQCRQQAHDEIWAFHNELKQAGIRHVMFNGNNHFEDLSTHYDWGTSYIDPYNATKTYDFVLRQQGFVTVRPDSWHFGPEAHCFWGEYLLQYIKHHQLLGTNEIPANRHV